MTAQEIEDTMNAKLAQSTDNKGYAYKTLAIACLVAFIIGAIVGSYVTKLFYPTLTETVKTIPVVTEKVKVVTDTQIQYVPKETIVYQGVESKENTDVQLNADKSKVNIKVNGKDYEFDLLQGETQKFKDGKVSMQQTSDISMDIKIPTIDLTRHNILTGGAMYTDGKIEPGVGYTGSINKVLVYQVVGSQSAQFVGIGIKF